MMFEILLTAAAFIAGAIASVTGFGIGSVLTPLLSDNVGTKVAVAAGLDSARARYRPALLDVA